MSHPDQPQRGRRAAVVTTGHPVVTPSKSNDQTAVTQGAATQRPRDAARRARQAAQQPSATVSASASEPLPFPLNPSEPVTASVVSPSAKSAGREVFSTAATDSAAPMPALPRRSAVRQNERLSQQANRTDRGVSRAHLAQRGSIAMAATGLALAVIVPSTTAALSDPVALVGNNNDALSAAPVSADSGASVTFDGAAGASNNDPDNKLKDVLKVSANKVAPLQSKGTLGAPLEKLQTNSPFGYRVNPLTGAAGELHTGQDFAAQCGTPVFASAGGTVSFASWDVGGGGNRVVIDHGNGLSTTYNHNTSLNVAQGQKVNRGDLVSMSGTTGNSTGCHVHFEVMVDNKTVDPMNWLATP